jgi:O-antigen/teichoic acid export membrane protein
MTERSPSSAALPKLSERMLRGSFFVLGSFTFKSILRFGSNLLLAHLLFPEAFALVVLCSIVIQGLEMLSDMGIQPAVIQSSRSDDEAFLNTAWTFQALRGIILWILASGLAWPMAHWYNEPQLIYLVPVAALSSVLTGFQSIGVVTAMRRVHLGKITVWGLAETLLKTLITIMWALVWPSVWALIGGTIVANAISSLASHRIFPEIRHRFAWDRSAAYELWHFGRWIFVSTLLTYLSQQVDKILLGRLMPIGILGIYSISYNLARLPMDIASSLMGSILYPAVSEIVRTDRQALQAKLTEARGVILAASQFGIVGVILVSPWFFKYLYDDRYLEAAHFAPLLATAVWFSILHACIYPVLVALGDIRSLAWSNLVKFLSTAAGCLLGHHYFGMPGFIMGNGVGCLVGYLFVARTLARHQVSVIGQDLFYSGLIAAIAILCGAIPWRPGVEVHQPLLAAPLGIIGLVASGLIAFRALRPTIRRLMALRERSTDDPGG